MNVRLSVLGGELTLSRFDLADYGSREFKEALRIAAGQQADFKVPRR
jgi:hypothetical protein